MTSTFWQSHAFSTSSLVLHVQRFNINSVFFFLQMEFNNQNSTDDSCIVAMATECSGTADDASELSDTESSSSDEKCYLTLSAVKHVEELPHVLQAVKGLNSAGHVSIDNFELINAETSDGKWEIQFTSTCGRQLGYYATQLHY